MYVTNYYRITLITHRANSGVHTISDSVDNGKLNSISLVRIVMGDYMCHPKFLYLYRESEITCNYIHVRASYNIHENKGYMYCTPVAVSNKVTTIYTMTFQIWYIGSRSQDDMWISDMYVVC